MPPPVPSVKGKEKEAALKKEEEKNAADQNDFAQAYNNVESAIGGGGGCFTGDSMVLMGDRTLK